MLLSSHHLPPWLHASLSKYSDSVVNQEHRRLDVRLFVGNSNEKSASWAYAQQLHTFLLSFDPTTALRIQDPQCIEGRAVDATLRGEGQWIDVVAIFILSTYADGTPPPSSVSFLQSLKEEEKKGRPLCRSARFCVVGLGSSVYGEEHFCRPARELERQLIRLGLRRLTRLCLVDDCKESHLPLQRLQKDLRRAIPWLLESHTRCNNQPNEEIETEDVSTPPPVEGCDSDADMEDLVDSSSPTTSTSTPPSMITSRHGAKLTKEGYKLVGSHSAVKMCRWTKAHLRGRGGCYKHTFYGISSMQCMEATPSLACANKCVFCWRHHKNPVGTRWQWAMDDPEDIVDAAIDKHKRMVLELKGAAGVTKESLERGYQIQHCALSLVGEPIMYPEINRFLDNLHNRHISSFLVTNGQFPEALRHLRPCTQLYISVDASSRDSLKAVDRPLFSDYWERFLSCLEILRGKRQRTVFRLTLVKEFNMEEVEGYGYLVEKGQPDFIEIKAVTYCGTSTSSSLSMKNVPWHEEVIQFAQCLLLSLGDLADDYELMAEHRHSCSLLIAHKRFYVEGAWHTWIDYEMFDELSRIERDTGKSFSSLDYCAKTPEWALWGADDRGFDPSQRRVYTKGKLKGLHEKETV